MDVWILPHKIYSIIDKASHKILTAGQILTYKKIGSTYIFISFDNIHFFNIKGTANYHCATDISENEIQLTEIPEHYIIIPYMQRWTIKYTKDRGPSDLYLIDPKTVDVYLEKDLDPEVIPLVNALNKIPNIKTITSCSGHNETCMEIDCYCYSFDALKFLIKIMPKDIMLKKSPMPSPQGSIAIKINSTCFGEQGYKQANNFAKIIMDNLP